MDFVDQLKDQVDIVQVIGEYIRLRKAGPRYVALCPFHVEKTASFSVHPGHQFFKCFGCGEGGDVLSFVMKIESISFYEALKLLADRNGLQIPKREGFADDDTKMRASVYRMHEIAEAEFRKQLASAGGAEARAYLVKRGVSQEWAAHFGLGFAPKSGVLAKVLQKDFSPEEIEESGLILKREDGSYYERFRNRLMFPIHNESGKPIAFGGRALAADEQPKYLNSPETKLYRKSSVLYNLHRAKDAVRKNDRSVLVEGYMDVIGVTAAGVPDVIASCGTALTTQQVQLVKRQSSNIVVNFDPDNAGAKGSEKSIQILIAESMRVKIVSLEEGLDPDEYCRKHGADAYAAHLQRAASYFHWLAQRARGKFDMRSAEGRYEAFQFLLPAIQGLNDKLERVAVAEEVAGLLGVNSGVVLENFRKLAADRTAKPAERERPNLRHSDKIMIRLLLASPEARDQFIPYIKKLPGLSQTTGAKIYEALIAVHDAGSPLSYGTLHARLPDADQDLLAQSMLRDETEDAVPSLDEGMACLSRMVEEERERESLELKGRVRDAERAGNAVEALRLYGELMLLQKSSKKS